MSLDTMHRCIECGYEAAPGADDWRTVQHPPLGELTQCPQCGSTNTRTL